VTGRASVHAELERAFTGREALPRANGELVFEAPWQSRAFAMVVALHREGVFEWEEFRRRLIARIGAWDAVHGPEEPYAYYEHWLGALQDVLAARGIFDPAAVEALAAELAARPPGHDHGHEHPHA
jgi:nitrile hydratase accessory protein